MLDQINVKVISQFSAKDLQDLLEVFDLFDEEYYKALEITEVWLTTDLPEHDEIPSGVVVFKVSHSAIGVVGYEKTNISFRLNADNEMNEILKGFLSGTLEVDDSGEIRIISPEPPPVKPKPFWEGLRLKWW